MQMQISVNENEYMINYYKNNEMNLFVIMMMMLFVDYLLEILMHELDFLLNIQNMHGNKLNLLMTIDK